MKTERDWGFWSVHQVGPGYKVKTLTIYPGKSLSVQYHLYRAEQWTVLTGSCVVNGIMTLQPKDTIYIPVKMIHTVQNIDIINCEILEIQFGSKCEEEDIIRLNASLAQG